MSEPMSGTLMLENVVEVERAELTTFDGESLEVQGGAWLSPEAVLRTTSELDRLRRRAAEQDAIPKVLPAVLLGAGLVGLAVGFWLGRRTDD
ncbi:MAG: hypothetical protein JNJ54_10975 [Myxococcaceae bacterium]|nr:hypothetical protein [Myxococcaceae bacterium]